MASFLAEQHGQGLWELSMTGTEAQATRQVWPVQGGLILACRVPSLMTGPTCLTAPRAATRLLYARCSMALQAPSHK